MGWLNHLMLSKEGSVKKVAIAAVVFSGVGSAEGSPGQSCCTGPVAPGVGGSHSRDGGSLDQLSHLQPPAHRKMNKTVLRMQN